VKILFTILPSSDQRKNEPLFEKMRRENTILVKLQPKYGEKIYRSSIDERIINKKK
jgi:hypothetical protein